MYYKSTSITKRTKTATVLLVVAALASVLVGGSIVESAHLAFAHKDDRKRAIEQPTNIDQKAVCETAGGNSPIDASCNNTAITHNTNTGGIGGARAGTGDDGSIEQPTNIHQKTECLTAGGNSGIQGSCLNAGGTTTSNTGGINTNMGSSSTNMGSSSTNMGSIKLPFGGFP
jgi:hypothetical protein